MYSQRVVATPVGVDSTLVGRIHRSQSCSDQGKRTIGLRSSVALTTSAPPPAEHMIGTSVGSSVLFALLAKIALGKATGAGHSHRNIAAAPACSVAGGRNSLSVSIGLLTIRL